MKTGFHANRLKLIAIAAMTADHIAWAMFPGYTRALLPVLMHILGRITCPIMCYFIAEGYHHTKNIRKYTARLFFFSIISHFAYVFFSAGPGDWRAYVPFFSGQILNQTSVIWALAWGLVMLRIAFSETIPDNARAVLIMLVCLLAFPSDWSCIASLCILAFGTNRTDFNKQMFWMVFYVGMYAAVYCFSLDLLYGLIQMAVVLAIPLLRLYNGQLGGSPRGNRMMKWAFYLYYPLHLLVLGWLRWMG